MNPAFLRALPAKTFSSVAHNLIDVTESESVAVPIVKHMRAFTLDALGLSALGMCALESKKNAILAYDETKGVPEHEKGLLTLMIVADIRDGSETSTTELSVSILSLLSMLR
ncbi:uncharacterized protein ATC70_002462 [Mucor velutinosus]|uniref:Uncharacterized protein n=1 Tax=Mucor velutinosus TaxID=708070 RepID=A0AAN7DDC0_9FUNG|nr:hypothetical protein ATC70_002462 [Mucor velutinosus]